MFDEKIIGIITSTIIYGQIARRCSCWEQTRNGTPGAIFRGGQFDFRLVRLDGNARGSKADIKIDKSKLTVGHKSPQKDTSYLS